jgi:hypothetical protein
VTLESSIGQGRLSGGGETVSGMSQRYDGAINYWDQTWGNRNKVAVAINGFYFGPPEEPAGVPWGGQVHSGWYAKRFWQQESINDPRWHKGFAWKLDRTAFISDGITHPENKQMINYFRSSSALGSQYFDGINRSRGTDELILYTPQYDSNTKTGGSDGKDPGAVEVLVQLSRPSMIVLEGNQTFGTIIEIRLNKGSTQIPFDHVVLSMEGQEKSNFESLNVQKGDQVGISQRVKNVDASLLYHHDCTEEYEGAPCDFAPTYASIGGAFYFLKNGAIQDFSSDPQANVRDPRTAIAFNDNYVYFIVADGRDERNSIGMTIPQLAKFARDELGATFGIAQDGGGSSTMVVNGEVMNNTYCNIVICKNLMFLPIVTNSGSKTQSGLADPRFENLPVVLANDPPPEQLSGDGLPLTDEYYTYAPDSTGDILQRLVANGMMMVLVEPKTLSDPIFDVDDRIKTLFRVNVRLGPGTNYGVIETVDSGTTGVILGNDNGLNGVWAKGYFWWHVRVDGPDGLDTTGWVIEPALTLNANFR